MCVKVSWIKYVCGGVYVCVCVGGGGHKLFVTYRGGGGVSQ